VVEIKKCDAIPGVVGEHAEIVRLQIQEFEKYTVYPVWVKMLSGDRKGKIYGFQYDEVEVLPEAFTGKTMKTKMVEQLEEILRGVPSVGAEGEGKVTKMKVVEQLEDALRAVKIGGIVEIKKCDSIPELVGEHGEIVEMQIQEFEKYTVYPVWVKILSGERKGKIYGFQYDEVEVLPKAFTGKMMKTKMAEQLEEILPAYPAPVPLSGRTSLSTTPISMLMPPAVILIISPFGQIELSCRIIIREGMYRLFSSPRFCSHDVIESLA
ncbi:unnamed protein product, partial [marine sediment metagenome]